MAKIRYALGDGARPMLIEPGTDYDQDRTVERLVPVDQTFSVDGRRYCRLVIGHGEWLDIPVEGPIK